MKTLQINNLNLNIIGYLLFFNLVLVFAPIYSLCLQFFFILRYKKRNIVIFQNLIFTISVILGLINTTKVLDSDLVVYVEWFKLASRLDFYDYVIMNGREYLYNALVYFLSLISDNNQNFFIASVSFIGYFILLTAVHRLLDSCGASFSLTFLVVVSLGFFPPLFNISAQVIRQFLALAILSVFLVNIITKNKYNWLLFVCAILIHSSVLFFFPFLLIPILKRQSKFEIIFLSIIIMYLIVKFAAPFIGTVAAHSDMSMVGHLGNRLIQEKHFKLSGIGVKIYILIFITYGLIIYKSYFDKSFSKDIYAQGYFLTSNIFIILSGFIIFMNYLDSTSELAGRFTFYLYVLIPIIGSISFSGKIPSVPVSLLLIMFMSTYFLYNIFYGVWTYINITNLFLMPIYTYF